MKRPVLLACLAVAAGLGSALPGAAQTTLKMAHTLPASDTHHLAAQRFAEAVKQRTNGQIQIEVHAGGALGNDPSILQHLLLGADLVVDLGVRLVEESAPLGVADVDPIDADRPRRAPG